MALAGLPDVRRIRSTSQLGVAQVTVEFEPDADYYRSRQLVAERVAQTAGAACRPAPSAPLLSSLTGRLNEIFELTLEAEPGAADLMTLRDLAEFEVENRLLAVPGVAAVERLGGYLRQFQVQLDPDRMSARGVTLDEVLHAVEGANLNAAGRLRRAGPDGVDGARGRARAAGIEDLRGTVVAVRGATPVLLGDVADVREAPAVRRGIAHRLRGEVVSCRDRQAVRRRHDGGRRGHPRARSTRSARTLPTGVELRVVYDQSELVDVGARRRRARGADRRAAGGARCCSGCSATCAPRCSSRSTMPLSIALAGLLLERAGDRAQHDDARRPRDRRRPARRRRDHRGREHACTGSSSGTRDAPQREQALARRPSRSAARSRSRPRSWSPSSCRSSALAGIEGRMYRPLAAAVIAAVAASLVLALTLVPIAAALLLRPRARRRARGRGADPRV